MTDEDKAARLQRGMIPVRERFRQRCAADLARLRAGEIAPAELHVIAHRLAGMGLTMGFPELGHIARVIDDCLTGGREPSREQMTALEAAMAGAVIP